MTAYISLLVVYPTSFIIPTSVVAVNGSSVAGNCSEISQLINRGSLSFACLNPTSSVLLDGVVPEFIDKEDDMWARDLFTLQSTSSNSLNIEFRFADNTGVGRIEVVLFQCPQCNIFVETISITDTDNTVFGITKLSLSSCDSLVKVCIEVDMKGVFPVLFVVFNSSSSFSSAQAYIAEVTFYSSTSSVCSLTEEIVNITANTDETTNQTTDEETTTDSAMSSEAFIILTSITATLATVINYTTGFSMP